MSPIIPGVIASGISGHLTPPWSPEGAYDALATVSLSTATASVTFAGIPSGYKHLQIRGLHRATVGAGDGTTYIQFNGDTGSNYSRHRLYGYGGGGSPGTDTESGATAASIGHSMGATPSLQSFTATIVDVLDYSSTVKNKTIRAITGTDLNGDASGALFYNNGAWYNTSAVNSITITTNQTAFATYSSFALYGVK
jgi:hypothetical protein